MSETKWTPGPWESGWGDGLSGPRCAPSVWLDGNAIFWPVRHGRDVVCWLIASIGSEPIENLKADACRIAAVPELYEALRQVIDDLPLHRDWLNPDTERMARAALKKARGEA